MEQLEELNDYCKEHENVYIYEHGHTQLMIAKYLGMAKNIISGFLVHKKSHSDYQSNIPVIAINGIFRRKIDKDAGVIIATPDCDYNDAVRYLQSIGLTDFFFCYRI